MRMVEQPHPNGHRRRHKIAKVAFTFRKKSCPKQHSIRFTEVRVLAQNLDTEKRYELTRTVDVLTGASAESTRHTVFPARMISAPSPVMEEPSSSDASCLDRGTVYVSLHRRKAILNETVRLCRYSREGNACLYTSGQLGPVKLLLLVDSTCCPKLCLTGSRLQSMSSSSHGVRPPL